MADAKVFFQQILDQGALDEKDMVAAKEEVGWCFVNEGQLEQGRDVLEEVVQVRDERWEREGKTDEAFARARAWYRLGETEWRIGGESGRDDSSDDSDDDEQGARRGMVHGVHSGIANIRTRLYGPRNPLLEHDSAG